MGEAAIEIRSCKFPDYSPMKPSLHRTLYHTHIKCLAREGLLPEAVLKQIPRSNIHRWRSECPDKYRAFESHIPGDDDYNLILEFARHKTAKRVFAVYVRIIKTALSLAHALPGFRKIVKEHSKQIVEMINRARPILGLQTPLRFFNLSVSTFRQWSFQSFTVCFQSLTRTCNRVYPNQLSRPQVELLRKSLLDPRFQYWPVSSIALHTLRSNVLALSLNTWYKYVHKLGIIRHKPESRRKKTAVSIRAERPHQLWHADITSFVTTDYVRHYIYLVVDNFSRKILSWKVADAVNAAFRQDSIRQALEKIAHRNERITLITDGGPENNLHSPLNEISLPVEHKKALIDVQYSNSLIEAHNKILKYNYLYRMEIRNGELLQKALAQIINDFNSRPHISLGGLTPNEAEQGLSLNRRLLSRNIQQSTRERREYNRLHQCGHCKS